MERQFWLDRWSEGRTAWDQAAPNRLLTQHWSTVELADDATVFVPLCGRSVDMAWLAGRGHRVLGSELSEAGVLEFFDARSIVPDRRVSDGFVVYSGGRYELWCGDLFELAPTVLADVDAVYDRASLVALPPAMRRRYCDFLSNMLPPRAAIFVVAFEYDQADMDGPPFSVTRDEIAELFDRFEPSTLADDDALDANPELGTRGVGRLRETATLLRRRAG